jgi:uncharacterized membrane protein YGL010W
MKTLTEQLTRYAAYHRDPRNIATHFVGIPLIVLAVIVVLSRPGWNIAEMVITPALIAVFPASLFYLRLDLRLGLTMTVLLASGLWVGAWLAALPAGVWLASGITLFVTGWVMQFIGHYYEGRKPAFVDDLIGLLIGPLFVLAEAAFALGLRNALRHAIEARVGPVRQREKSASTI